MTNYLQYHASMYTQAVGHVYTIICVVNRYVLLWQFHMADYLSYMADRVYRKLRHMLFSMCQLVEYYFSVNKLCHG